MLLRLLYHPVQLLLVCVLMVTADRTRKFFTPTDGHDRDEAECEELATLSRDNSVVMATWTDNAKVFVAFERGRKVLRSAN